MAALEDDLTGKTWLDGTSVASVPAGNWVHIALVVDRGASCQAGLSSTTPSCVRVALYTQGRSGIL